MRVAFRQVDVFTDTPFKGNPVAVIMDAQGLSTEQMQAIANWTNLSETTFVLPPTHPEADYRVRIFTPLNELPFAGHPTLGTACALLEAGLIQPTQGQLIQESGIGLVPLTVIEQPNTPYTLSFTLPNTQFTPLTEQEINDLEGMLGCAVDRDLTPILVDVGPRWIVAKAKDAQTVLDCTPDFATMGRYHKSQDETGVCLYGYWGDESEQRIEVRSFAPSCGVDEDPVCGSGNGSVAAFIRHYSDQPSLLIQSTQGSAVGRNGKIRIEISPEAILIGGQALTCVEGEITLPR
jgi:PhzF family phenazine biosynthesis protein